MEEKMNELNLIRGTVYHINYKNWDGRIFHIVGRFTQETEKYFKFFDLRGQNPALFSKDSIVSVIPALGGDHCAR